MIPPCAQNVLQSFGSLAFVTRRTLIPAAARVKAVVSPAIPVPITSAGKWSRLFTFDTRRYYHLMRRASLVAIAFLAACATSQQDTSKRVPGHYAIYFEPSFASPVSLGTMSVSGGEI